MPLVLFLLLFLGGCGTVYVVGDETGNFTAMTKDSRPHDLTRIDWDVREDASEYCLSVGGGKRAGLARGARPIACAILYRHESRCVVVTNARTNHTVLGHEMRHCFEGNFHN